MIQTSYFAAFFGGLLSLLSPCSALLVPAFFAYAFQSRRELLSRTLVFYLGLAAMLVPLGMGSSVVGMLFFGHRQTLILVSGILIIALGVMQLAGQGFSIGPIARLQNRIQGDSWGATLALGAVYGLAGFCSGPILGAVLTVAASSGHVLTGAALLATYAAGMAAPLFVLALLWDRFNLGRRRWLRGKELTIGGLRVHTTNLISGLMFILLGLTFIVYQGTSALSGLYESNGAVDAAFAAEEWIEKISRDVPDILFLILLAGIVLAVIILRRRNVAEKDPAAEPVPQTEKEKINK